MKPSSYYDHIVDVMEELLRITVLMRQHASQLVDRYSERKAAGVKIDHSADRANAALTDGLRPVCRKPTFHPQLGNDWLWSIPDSHLVRHQKHSRFDTAPYHRAAGGCAAIEFAMNAYIFLPACRRVLFSFSWCHGKQAP